MHQKSIAYKYYAWGKLNFREMLFIVFIAPVEVSMFIHPLIFKLKVKFTTTHLVQDSEVVWLVARVGQGSNSLVLLYEVTEEK